MRTRLSWIKNLLLGAGCLALSAGCATKAPIKDLGSAFEAESQPRLLNVCVSADPQGDKSAGAFANDVKKAVEGKLVGEGFAPYESNADMTVDMIVSLELFDQSGEYYRYNGNADATVKRTYDKKLLGQSVIQASGERKLGAAAAITALSGKLGKDTAQWVASTATPAKSGLAANDISIKRPFLGGGDPAYVRTFIEKAGSLEGVLSCVLVAQDYNARTMVFRIVYYKDSFPEGILNRLALIPELGLKPKM